MAYSLVIKNGRIVDGTGRPSFIGDIGVEGDTITAVGRVADCNGAVVIDAGGKVVSPGFIEIHTHYDPQLCWDRTASPAGEHGVTTVVVGNCGLSLAPVQPGFGSRVTKLFNKIEDIETSFFDSAVPYSWTSFGEYLDFIRGGLGVNIAPVIGHSILRHFVMGEAAQQRTATDDEIAQMCDLLREAIAAGGFGLSMSYPQLKDEHDRPMASSYADTKERIALARAVVESGRQYVQAAVDVVNLDVKLREYEELGEISLASGACCSALTLMDFPSNQPGQIAIELAKLAELQAAGAKLYAQTMTRPLDISFRLSRAANLFYAAPVWSGIMVRPLPERKQRLSDRSIWPDLHAGIQDYTKGRGLGDHTVRAVYAPENAKYEGRRLKEIAESEGITDTEAMLKIALADDFETLFGNTGVHSNVEVVSMLLDHPLVQMGGSDAGAHVAQFAGEGDATFMLKHFVRDHGKFTLERAVQLMTSDLARDFGISRRGSILPGNFADLVVFDPEEVGRGPEISLRDLPGGGERFVRQAVGIDKVIVNGRVFVDGGAYTDAREGRTV